MDLRALLLGVTAAATFLLVPGCGGGDGGGGGSSQPPPAPQPQQSPPANNSSSGGTGSSGTGNGSTCQSQPVVGGALLVAQAGPVVATLLDVGNDAFSSIGFAFGFPPAPGEHNPQDNWGAGTQGFTASSPVGSTVQMLPSSGFTAGEEFILRAFTQGPPFQVTTSSFDKDLGHWDATLL